MPKCVTTHACCLDAVVYFLFYEAIVGKFTNMTYTGRLEWLFVFVLSLKRHKVGGVKTEVFQWIPWQKLFMNK